MELSIQEIDKCSEKFGHPVGLLLQKDFSISDIRDYVNGGRTSENSLFAFVLGDPISDEDALLLLKYLDYLEYRNSRLKRIDRNNFENTLTSVERKRVVVSKDDSSAWKHYRNHLEDEGFENVDDIESASRNILEMLSIETEPGRPVRGAVIGNVQSGKTVNMESLMSMACDNGWNLFVILSGTIEKLREQTEDRMLADLRGSDEDPLRFDWQKIRPNISRNEFQNDYNLDFAENSNKRFFTVILKNVSHLRKLIRNLYSLPNIDRINLIIIDDEADLASINTSRSDRTKINKLIVDLIEGRDADGRTPLSTFSSVNYICYTATPYAVLLNEEEGLYPADFITALTPSKRYFGLDRIFGSERYDGMNIVKVRGDIQTSFEDMEDDVDKMPTSMKDCIAWFVCCVAVLRHRGDYHKPVSLLMNVDSKQLNHRIVDRVVVNYLKFRREDLFDRCRAMYEERNNFTVEDFKKAVWDYGIFDEHDSFPTIRDFPPYESIRDLVHEIVYTDATRIEMDDENNPKFDNTGIHVCVDNCKGLSDAISDEEKYTCRLFYPKDDNPVLNGVPAFIVIGGNTLSRGLTIKGLVATYFRRIKIKQADSLLQMARWFGFRNGYELMPRIWMDADMKSAFEDLSRINDALLREISELHNEGVTPRDYHIRIMQVPEAHMLKSLTARNKSQGAVSTNSLDFSGSDKEFHEFYRSLECLEGNMQLTEQLLGDIAGYECESERGGYLFKGVPFDRVLSYLNSFCRIQNKYSSSPDSSIKWLLQVKRETIGDFDVFLTGNVSPKNDGPFNPVASFCNGRYRVNKIGRNSDNVRDDDTAESKAQRNVKIKTVRDKKDMLADIPLTVIESFDPQQRRELQSGDIKIRNIARMKAGLEHTPLLVIYVVYCENLSLDNIVAPAWYIPKGAESEMIVSDDREFVYLDYQEE